jgi:hypothetical protein
MKFTIFIISLFISIFCLAQKTTSPCDKDINYQKQTYRKYANIKTVKLDSTFLGEKGRYYISDSSKRVRHYLDYGDNFIMRNRARITKSISYYDTCKTRAKEVQTAYHYNGKQVEKEFYENGKIKSEKIIHFDKSYKLTTWDSIGRKKIIKQKKPIYRHDYNYTKQQ